MKLLIFAIYDSATEAYMRPWYMQTEAAAMRTFTDICSDADHEMAKNPHDYTLMTLGSWNDNDGSFSPEIPRKLLTALEAVARSRQVDKAQLAKLDDEVTKCDQ